MKLLDQVRQVLRTRHYAYRTEQCYCEWIVKFIRFHGLRHPNTLGVLQVEAFLTHLAVADHVAASTQNQALGALLFLYRDELKSTWRRSMRCAADDVRTTMSYTQEMNQAAQRVCSPLDSLHTERPAGI